MKEVKQGHCLLCGKYGELTFEHVPPQSAYNDKPIFIQLPDHLIESQSPVFGKKMKSNKGFGGYTLCAKCNNDTGAWYGKAFADFVKQGMKALERMEHPGYIQDTYIVKPLNVFKQIMTMFLSADKSGYLQTIPELVTFILDKASNNLPKRFKVYLYSNASSHKRMIGYSIAYDPQLGIQRWSEINFQPFGYLLADDSGPAHPEMVDITNFSRCVYHKDYEIKLTSRYLSVSNPLLGMYD